MPVESSNFWTTISFYYFHSFRVPIRPVFQDLLRQRRRREVRLELQRRWRRQIQERRFLTSTQSLTRVNIWSGYQTWIWHELFKQIIESCHKNKPLYCNCERNVGTLHMGNKCLFLEMLLKIISRFCQRHFSLDVRSFRNEFDGSGRGSGLELRSERAEILHLQSGLIRRNGGLRQSRCECRKFEIFLTSSFLFVLFLCDWLKLN